MIYSPEKIGVFSKLDPILINPRLPEAEKNRLFTQLKYAPSLAQHIWVLTSGSTQGGKWIALSHEALLTSAEAVNKRIAAQPDDVWIKALPSFHVGGLGILMRAHLSGAKVIELGEKWNPREFYQAVREQRGTLISLVPTQLHDLVKHNLSAPAHVRAVIIGGAKLSTDLFVQASELGWPLYPSYGLTEASSQVATALNAHEFELCPLSHVQVKIQDRFIALKSPSLLTGWLRTGANGEAIWEDPKVEGWLVTEDLGRFEAGVLHPLGRESDIVKVGGEFVSLMDLRAQIPLQRADSWTVVAISDARLGHKVVAVTEEAEPQFEWLVNLNVAPFARPREWVRVDQFPRSPLGKILWRDLQDRVEVETNRFPLE